MFINSCPLPPPPPLPLPPPPSLLGLARGSFENKDVTFQHHIMHDHNVWNYLFFIVHLLTKHSTEFTGPESYVYEKIKPVCTLSM